MYFDTKSVGGTTEILASNDYQAVPVTITGGELVKAGMPIKADGSKIAAGTGAIGILLYDVDPNRDPNGAVVVDGIINWDKCKDHVGEGLSIGADEISKILTKIVFRDKAGKTYVGGAAAE